MLISNRKMYADINLTAATAAAKSLQSCPTLCDPTDGSPPGSVIPGILQARILEWVFKVWNSLISNKLVFYFLKFCHNMHIILNNSGSVGSFFSRLLWASSRIIRQFWRTGPLICFTVILLSLSYKFTYLAGSQYIYTLQCSCLENPRDGGAWWAAIYGVAQSQTRLKWLSSSSNTYTFDICIQNTHILKFPYWHRSVLELSILFSWSLCLSLHQ